jgi:predicted nuclease of restriction endonuclease-like (RecB) superfamily
VVETLAQDLRAEFPGGQGYSARNLWYMRNFYEHYQANPKLQPLVAEISWSHNLVILEKCKDDLEREFYIQMTRKFGWSKNVLVHQVEGKSYEKFLLNQTNFDQAVPEKYRHQAQLAVKDEYNFDFLEIGDSHSEKELELALLRNIGRFLAEMGGALPSSATSTGRRVHFMGRWIRHGGYYPTKILRIWREQTS